MRYIMNNEFIFEILEEIIFLLEEFGFISSKYLIILNKWLSLVFILFILYKGLRSLYDDACDEKSL